MLSHLLCLAAVLAPWASSTIVPFPVFVGNNGFGTSATISQSCTAALNSTINCDADLRVLALTNTYLSPNSTSNAASLCAASCNSSLATYHSNVVSKCGSSPVIDAQLQNTYMGDLFQGYYDLVCTKDPGTSQYCFGLTCSVDFLQSSYAALGNISSFDQLPHSVACSVCQVSFYQSIQKSPFLGYNADAALNWLRIQNLCGLSFPLGVDAASNLTYGTPPKTADVSVGCASGSTYTVQNGDTCQSIAVAHSVSQGTLWAINNLTPDCSALTVGKSLCLPKPCDLYTLKPNDTCWSIASQKGVSFSSLFGFNPTISLDCSNLNATGSVICISNPEGIFAPPPPSGLNPNALEEYATGTVPAPGPTPFLTTPQCGGFYQAQIADTCGRISLAAGVRVDLFRAINPSIDADCFNLVPDLWYCVHPTRDWNTTSRGNSTTTSTIVPPPAPTPPGTTATCFKWHVVVSGDTCSFLQNTLGVTMAQLVLWNPDLKADCSNLLLGEAYCISGPQPSSSASRTASASLATSSSATAISRTTSSSTTSASRTTSSSVTQVTVAPPAPTPPGTTGACAKWHVVVSGDTCFAIEQAAGITMAQLVLWNPNLKADCSNLLLGDAYCIGVPTVSPSTTTATGRATVAPPAPTPPGTTGSCFTWHVVVSGDTCFAVEQAAGITMAQLVRWNPNLKSDCSNLLLGEAYCVSGPA